MEGVAMSIAFQKARTIRRELMRKYRQVGVYGTVRHATAKLFLDMRTLMHPSKVQADTFDRIYGTDTSGIVGVGALDIPDSEMEHSMHYGTLSEEEFMRIMNELPIDWGNLVFVDLGSGKGRALLLASRYPFKQVIGVELSRMLHERALRNIELFHDERQRCRDLRSICLNATEFEIPPVPLFLFLANPFDDQIMHVVADRLDESLQKKPRKLYVFYVKPEYRRALDEMASLMLVRDTGRRSEERRVGKEGRARRLRDQESGK